MVSRGGGYGSDEKLPTWVIVIIVIFLVCSVVSMIYWKRESWKSPLSELGAYFALRQ